MGVMGRGWISLALVCVWLGGCEPGGTGGAGADATAQDAQRGDARPGDAARPDGEAPVTDGAAPDAAPPDGGHADDAGRPDALPLDALPADAQVWDAATALDAAAADLGPLDAEPVDAGPLDAEMLDAAPVDAEAPDALQPDAAPPVEPPPPPLITEIMARNANTLLDEDGEASDWIELYNPGDTPYVLTDHHLTDDLDAPRKWALPETVLAPRAFLVVFASGKDRAVAGAPLHTSFRLSGDGETVALTTRAGRVLHAIDDFPLQVSDVSFGLPMAEARAPLLSTGDPARLWVGADLPDAQAPGFDDSDWQPVAQGVGIDTRPAPGPLASDALLASDLAPHLGLAEAFWLRIPFRGPEGPGPVQLALTFDDGLSAWLDGAPIYSHNAGPGPVADRPITRAAAAVQVPLAALAPGAHLLALRVANAPTADGLFFAHAAVDRLTLAVAADPGYLPLPTPGAPNVGAADLPPIVADVDRHQPLAPGEALDIGAQVIVTHAPIDTVTLVYRAMFGPEVRLEMVPDGDRWTARLPADVAGPGELVRWAVEATDVDGRLGRFPPFLDPTDSEEYVGTLVTPPPIDTQLPVFHWFVEDLAAAQTERGTRGALWFDGELYDNIEIDLHGQATTSFPKKSYNFDFNRDHRFRVRDDLERVKDFDLLTNYADKSKMRNTLAYGMFRDAGHDAHLVFPVRVHRNGEFFAVYEFVEDPDERWLRRMGYTEPLGAIYKCYDTLSDASRSEKKTREAEGNADLVALVDALSLPPEERRLWIYDHVDLARMANFLAMLFITSGNDCCTKNYYAYHDLQADQWWFMPCDLDLSLGRNWTGNYFDDRMFPENGLYRGNNNRLVTTLYGLPEFDAMYLRRARTLTDLLMQPADTPYAERYLENAADALQAHIGADAVLDNAAWDTWGEPQSMAEAVEIMKVDWMGPRRAYLYGQLVSAGEAPAAVLLDGRPGAASARWWVPTDDGLGLSWTLPDFDDAAWPEGPLGMGYENGAGYEGLIRTEVRPQQANPNATNVWLRTRFQVDGPLAQGLVLRMKYDDGYVAWLNGVEVARRNVGPGPVGWRDSAEVHDDGAAIRFEAVDLSGLDPSPLRMGENVLAIQLVNAGAGSSDLLVQPELVDGVAGADGPMPAAQRADLAVRLGDDEVAGAESYVVIHNDEATAVDLSGWRLSGRGVEHTLAAGTVIPAEGSLYVVAHVPSFRDRAEGPRGGQGLLLQGNWTGDLEPAGAAVAPLELVEAPR